MKAGLIVIKTCIIDSMPISTKRKKRKPLPYRLHDFFLPHERNEYRPHVFHWVSLAIIVLIVLVLEAGALVQTKIALTNSRYLASVLPAILADLTNRARAEYGDSSLSENPKLDEAAQLAANDMARNGYFAHVSPGGKTPWDWLQQSGYNYKYAGENLAVNFGDTEALQEAWMNSPTHKENILKPQYTEVGFATAQGMYEGQQTTFIVEFFGTPKSVTSARQKPAPPLLISAVSTPESRSISTTSGAVLGVSTPPPATPVSSVLGTEQPKPPHPSWFKVALTAPISTTALALSALIALVVALMIAAVVRHWRMPHPQALAGAALILVFAFGILSLNANLTSHVQFPVGDSLSASAISALGP
ncbi:MAG TPA: CAP domain-containing protein [Stellaceae bacterium]|nr:CAP domain-containing protein [Stellaceae bacterium]